jgi:hypothetical protein
MPRSGAGVAGLSGGTAWAEAARLVVMAPAPLLAEQLMAFRRRGAMGGWRGSWVELAALPLPPAAVAPPGAARTPDLRVSVR